MVLFSAKGTIERSLDLERLADLNDWVVNAYRNFFPRFDSRKLSVRLASQLRASFGRTVTPPVQFVHRHACPYKQILSELAIWGTQAAVTPWPVARGQNRPKSNSRTSPLAVNSPEVRICCGLSEAVRAGIQTGREEDSDSRADDRSAINSAASRDDV
jgi:hypothetical protein